MVDLLGQVLLTIARRPLAYLLAVLSLGIGVAAFLCVGALNEGLLGNIYGRFFSDPKSQEPLFHVQVRLEPEKGWAVPVEGSLDVREIERVLWEQFGRPAAVSTSNWLDTKIERRVITEVMVRAVSGVRADSLYLAEGGVVKGRPLNSADDREGSAVCVIPQRLAEVGFGTEDPIGQAIRIGGWQFRVVGVVEPEGISPGSRLLIMTVPLSAAAERFREQPVRQVQAWVSSTEAELTSDMNRAEKALGEKLGKSVGVGTDSWWLEARKMRRLAAAIRLRVGLLASLLLLAGLMGMVSMLLANVSGRMQEIGVHRALGATQWRQASGVLCEAGVTGLIGAAVGIMFGLGILALVSAAFQSSLHTTPWWLAAAVIASTVTALLAGTIPARAAMKMSPVDALRAQ